MKTELFLAWRYLKPQRNVAAVITVISIVGVTLGVAVLMVVLAVMTGFTDLIKEKLIDTQAHFQVQGLRRGGVIRQPRAALELLKKAGADVSPVIASQALAQVRKMLDARVFALGIESADIGKSMKLDQALLAGSFALGKGEIVISSDMAGRWGVGLGSRILLHSPAKLTDMVQINSDGTVEANPDNTVYLPAEFTVAGIYHIGKADFDRSVLFINRADAAELFELPLGAATALYGWLDNPMKAEAFANRVGGELERMDMRIMTWQELNSDLLGVLAVEKNMMFFLLIFIILVAAFSITNTLITSVYKKTREIGILKSLGASDGAVMRIFIYQGMLVGIMGSLIGAGLGFLIVTFRNDILKAASAIAGRDLFPKQFYFFDGLPAHIVWSDVLIIAAVSILLCTLGGVIPALRAARLDPAKALRYE